MAAVMNNKKTKILHIAIVLAACGIIAGVIIAHQNPLADPETELLKKICACILLAVAALLFAFGYERLTVLPRELWQSRQMIWKLAKNDFKKRYAGSYFGFFWALLQPVVICVMYWIVFDKVFNTRSLLLAGGIEVPYVLFLTSGLVPWFYFQESLTNGTQALVEYNYLVKKVVFNISILPIIKIIAATFIHLFFVGILLIIAAGYGYYPSIYTLQVLYYTLCAFFLVLAASYLTSAVVVFFKDLGQIIAIVLQVGMWATPILWDITMIPDSLKPLFKLNPMVYVVEGFRNSVYGEVWFFEHFYSSTYFWLAVAMLFAVGTLIFRRLRPHFADVL
jgi:teichoic acid transport system permease protein